MTVSVLKILSDSEKQPKLPIMGVLVVGEDINVRVVGDGDESLCDLLPELVGEILVIGTDEQLQHAADFLKRHEVEISLTPLALADEVVTAVPVGRSVQLDIYLATLLELGCEMLVLTLIQSEADWIVVETESSRGAKLLEELKQIVEALQHQDGNQPLC